MQIICKQSKYIYVMAGAFLFLFLFLFLYSTIFSSPLNLSVNFIIISIIYMLLLCVWLFCYLPNTRLIFDDSGITAIKKLQFLKKKVYLLLDSPIIKNFLHLLSHSLLLYTSICFIFIIPEPF